MFHSLYVTAVLYRQNPVQSTLFVHIRYDKHVTLVERTTNGRNTKKMVEIEYKFKIVVNYCKIPFSVLLLQFL